MRIRAWGKRCELCAFAVFGRRHLVALIERARKIGKVGKAALHRDLGDLRLFGTDTLRRRFQTETLKVLGKGVARELSEKLGEMAGGIVADRRHMADRQVVGKMLLKIAQRALELFEHDIRDSGEIAVQECFCLRRTYSLRLDTLAFESAYLHFVGKIKRG